MSVLVTGAANGLGRAITELFLQEGHMVIGVDKEEVSVEHDNLISFQADITDHNSIQGIRDNLKEQGVSVSIIINNAGFFRFFPITDCHPEQLESIFKVNALAPLHIISAFGEDLISNKGRVIQISSENVKLSGPFQPYPSSKIALESLSVGARQELELVGVKLIIVRPGAIDTALLKWNSPQSETYNQFLKKFLSQAKDKMSSIAEPGSIARVVLKAATTTKPKKIYNVNHNGWLSLFSKLPQGLQERIIIKMLK